MFFLTDKRGIVRHRDRSLGSERLVVFNNQDGRPPLAKRFEHVVIYSINIHREYAQLLVEAAFVQQSRHIFSRDERGLGGQLVLPKKIRSTQASDVFLGAVDHKTAPIVFHEQEAAIRLSEIFNTELDESAVGNFQVIDQELNDAILAPLRKHLELMLPKRPSRVGPLHLSQYATLINFDSINMAVQLQQPWQGLSHTIKSIKHDCVQFG